MWPWARYFVEHPAFVAPIVAIGGRLSCDPTDAIKHAEVHARNELS